MGKKKKRKGRTISLLIMEMIFLRTMSVGADFIGLCMSKIMKILKL